MRSSLYKDLRSGSWITPERIRLYSIVILIASAIELPILFLANSYVPFGVDFVVTWTADHIAITGGDFYNSELTLAVDRALTGIPDFFPFPYPPTYALLTAPLGTLPYHVALTVWMAGSLACFVGALSFITRRRGTLQILAFPAVGINLTNGQNGLAFAALFAAGLGLLKVRPILAGICIGLLSTKPHLGILIPVALIAGKEWRAFIAAGITVIALIGASVIIFGVSRWHEFFLVSEIYRQQLLVPGDPILAKIVTVFASIERFGGGAAMAYAIQIAALAAAVAFVFALWRSKSPYFLKQAGLIFSAVLATPYLFDYDLAILGIGIAAIAVAAIGQGFLPWEKTILLLLWLLPAIARPATMFSNVPIVPLAGLVGVGLVLCRVRIPLCPSWLTSTCKARTPLF